MHTISRGDDSVSATTRVLLLMVSVGELAAALAVHAVLKIITWQERVRERRQLATISDDMLRDVGLSRSQVDHEVRKPFWRI